jgi:mandelamide amidase
MPLTPLFDTIGPHARAVADLVLFDSVVTGDFDAPLAIRPDRVRLAVSRAHYFSDLDPEVARVASEALRRLTDAGVGLVEDDVPDLTRLVEGANFPVIYHDTVPMIASYLREFDTGITFEELLGMASAGVRENLEARSVAGGRLWVSPERYAAAREVHRPALQEAFRAYFRATGASAIVSPTTLVPATPIGEDQEIEIGGSKLPFKVAMSRNVAPASCAGIPGLVLCAGLTRDGLPVGIELDGPAGADRDLLALGLTLERVLGEAPVPEHVA